VLSSIVPVNKIFGKYDQQARMGELNRNNPIKTIQNQVDRVTISPEALKKRAIANALAAINNSNQVSTESKPASSDNVESASYADRIVKDALEKSKQVKEKEKEELHEQFEGMRERVKKSQEISENKEAEEAAKMKEQLEKEMTPF
tara:strand:+ start:335 stop:772 length:438 start_codon:yes stop_codon:yes gene_type:complete